MKGFTIKLSNPKFVKGIFEASSAILSETRLKVNQEELSMTGMDGSHICLLDLHVKKADCRFFETDESYELGLNLSDLVKIIKRGGANDQISLIHNPADKKLIIEMQAENSKKARKFSMALIDLESEEIDLDQLNAMPYLNSATLKLSIIDEALKDAEIFSEVLNIQSNDKLFRLWAEGTMGDMSYEVEKEELILSEFKENTEGAFAIQFLKNILKISSICDQVSIRLKSESPIHLKFIIENQIQQGEMDNGSYIQYFLAPRVEEDNDNQYQED